MMEPFLQHRDYRHAASNEMIKTAKFAEYLLVLTPHDVLCHEICALKEAFGKKYKIDPDTHTSNILLAAFQQFELMEARILPQLRTIASVLIPFKVELKGFGSLPSHTIFINVTSKIPVLETVKAFRKTQRLMKADDDHKPYFITEPSLVIARKLQPWQYEKGWQEYSNLHFHGRFIADHAVLLKREAGYNFKLLERLPFRGNKMVVQPDMFSR